MTKRGYGDGGIEPRGEGVYRLRYRVGGKKYSKTIHGGLKDARKELNRLTSSETHVAPIKMTVAGWIDQWIEAGAPGRKKSRVGQRTLERYEELLRVHVKPKLGNRLLQQLKATEIDLLYAELEQKIAPMTLHHLHTTFNACLFTAERKGLLSVNPMTRADVPSAGHADHGIALDEGELAALLAGFKPSPTMYPVVALAAATGLRRNEALALRWSDLDAENKTLRVERALDFTKKFGTTFKAPKTKRGNRTIALDDATIAVLLLERERHQRLSASIPDGVDVDLSLIRLPDDALMFPVPLSFTTPRNPRNFSKEFARRVGLMGGNIANMRFHDLRGTHATHLLNRNVPLHVVAQRLGDDPAVLLRSYAKHTTDNSMAAVLSELGSGILGG
jgi:integrase